MRFYNLIRTTYIQKTLIMVWNGNLVWYMVMVIWNGMVW